MAAHILNFITRFIISFFARFIFRLRISGAENIPVSGGVIVASNHLSYLDIPLMGYSLKRPAYFIGKKELFTLPFVGAFLRALGGIPIDRERPGRTAIRNIMKRLNSGAIVVIYPEGTRSPDGRLQAGKPGVGFIVRMSGKQVIPAAITGTDKAMHSGSWFIRPHPVTIRFGNPLDFSKKLLSRSDRDRVRAGLLTDQKQGTDAIITNTIMHDIAALLEQK
ncbi:MAG: 1-acyl-sn-glycerol-3-phosphate acyltransferase [Nitrospirae bacterium]|nr:1-acyl-sn-glycerol-3-phosphate acyltransferase [Nitrospirota bacterium]